MSSCTGRPNKPPAAFTSLSQIFMATSADLPLAASPPVSAMPNPILMGSAAWTSEKPSAAATAPAVPMSRAQSPSVEYAITRLLPIFALMLPLSYAHHARSRPGRAEPKRDGDFLRGGEKMRLMAFDDKGEAKLGVLTGEAVVDLTRVAP